MEAIADEVSGATTALVEQVLEEYGDPAETATEETGGGSPDQDDDEPEADEDAGVGSEGNDAQAVVASDGGPATGADGEPTGTTDEPVSPDPEAFTETQLTTLRAIHAQPEATQAELAAEFDVTSASISQRVASIEGLDWPDRQAFTETVFGAPAGGSEGAVAAEPDGGTATGVEGAGTGGGDAVEAVGDESGGTPSESGDEATVQEAPALADQLDVLSARVDRLDQQFEDRSASGGVALDPDLVHKVAHACLQSEAISEDEELRILEGLLGRTKA
ncbi:MarR family transcriptional regulator [Saliphagus infecundisoli]|uniref:MarR family transcriptional regulator n=2 Tax=Saliphagus infecundisoli TaxID=1849069 RepID=A0ABD5QIP2_9EURY